MAHCPLAAAQKPAGADFAGGAPLHAGVRPVLHAPIPKHAAPRGRGAAALANPKRGGNHQQHHCRSLAPGLHCLFQRHTTRWPGGFRGAGRHVYPRGRARVFGKPLRKPAVLYRFPHPIPPAAVSGFRFYFRRLFLCLAHLHLPGRNRRADHPRQWLWTSAIPRSDRSHVGHVGAPGALAFPRDLPFRPHAVGYFEHGNLYGRAGRRGEDAVPRRGIRLVPDAPGQRASCVRRR